jgi:hypothetical protein
VAQPLSQCLHLSDGFAGFRGISDFGHTPLWRKSETPPRITASSRGLYGGTKARLRRRH